MIMGSFRLQMRFVPAPSGQSVSPGGKVGQLHAVPISASLCTATIVILA